MDRKSKIFAPIRTVAGKRRPYREVPAEVKALRAVMDNVKKQAKPTMLKTCSYKSGDTIFTYENAQVQAFIGKKGTVCLVVNGDIKTMKESEALSTMPKVLDEALGEVKGEEEEGQEREKSGECQEVVDEAEEEQNE